VKKKRPGPKLPVAQFVAIIALSISVFLIIDLGRRAAANYRVQREAYRLGQEVETVRQHQARLLARRTYVASDLYVEEVARNELKWAKPDETVFVVLATPAANTSQPGQVSAEVTGPYPARTPAEAWWQLFFGEQTNQILLPPANAGESTGQTSAKVE
jgi:cell division protein FtsB